MTRWLLICIALLGFRVAEATDGLYATPFVTHTEALTAIMGGMYGDCMLSRWKFKGVDGCFHTWTIGTLPVTIPTPCFRWNNPKPEKVVNASFNRFHIGAAYPAPGLATEISWVNSVDPKATEPVDSAGGFRIGSFGFSGSITGYGYVAAPSIEVSTQITVLNALALLGLICNPLSDYTNQIVFGNVIWNSSNDAVNWNSNWKGWTSWYFYQFQTAYLASTATLFERTGMCSLQDRYAVFCDGSYGTMYPSTGVRNGTSGLLGVFMAGKNSALPAMAPFGFYGPLQNHIGGWAITTCHDIRAYGWLPVAPFMAYTRGHRNLTVQNLHAVSNVGSPQVLASAEATCTDDIGLGNSPGQIGAVGAMYSGESLQKLDPKDPVGAYLEYPFFTCCHWCTGVTPQAPSSPMGNDIYTQTGGTIDGSPATRFNVIGRGMLVQSIYTEMQ